MKKTLLLPFIAALILVACSGQTNNKNVEVTQEDVLNNTVMTEEDQERLTPDDVIAILKQGNDDFVKDNLTVRNNSERVRDASQGQYPKAIILSCLDSRVPVEDVFHRGIGDIFVARVAGNIINPDILGSMEYACKVSGSKLVLVLGHDHCGAIKSAIDDVELGNITTLLDKIKPAVAESRITYNKGGDHSSKNPEFVEHVCYTNVELAVKGIREQSPILKEMEDKGEIKIIGGIYDMHTGRVKFYKNIGTCD